MPEQSNNLPEAAVRPRAIARFLLVTGIGGGLLSYAWWADPATSSAYLPCTFHWLTGLHCPGCGGQRALHALLHGHLLDAMRFNALAVLIFAPVGAVAYGAHAWQCMGLGAARAPGHMARWTALFLLLAITYGVARNLPGAPFDLLRP
jgi:hypothetical protein